MPLAILANFVQSLKTSPAQSKGRLTVFPLRGPVPLPPEYVSLAGGFPLVEGQTGLLDLRDGLVEGCDVVSRPEVYRKIHDRLVRSYAMEALAEPPAKNGDTALDAHAVAEAFLQAAGVAESTAHKSPGLGEDVRLTAPKLAGSALVVDGQVVHLAAFSMRDEQQPASSPLASLRLRRRYRGI